MRRFFLNFPMVADLSVRKRLPGCRILDRLGVTEPWKKTRAIIQSGDITYSNRRATHNKGRIAVNASTKDLKEFIEKTFLFGQEITFSDDDSFLEMGIVDSTGVLELVMYLEEHFNITVDDDELVPENLDSINSLVAFVNRKLSPTSSTA